MLNGLGEAMVFSVELIRIDAFRIRDPKVVGSRQLVLCKAH